jgi:aminoglycoside N3'-acetyltransferase
LSFEKNVYDALYSLLSDKSRHIVVYSAIWPFARGIKASQQDFCKSLIDILIDRSKTLFMPTFTNGFVNGVCDLDHTPSTTGVLTEIFRNTPGVRRTVCPFFSFGVFGENTNETVQLRPQNAWGEGSLYEWFDDNNAYILTLGTHPTHCSFTHRAEWLCRNIIKYRYEKKFSGQIVHEGDKFDFQEILFVKNLQPSPKNDWTWAVDEFIKGGMEIVEVDGIKISLMKAKKKLEILVPMINSDPLVLIKNKDDFKAIYS